MNKEIIDFVKYVVSEANIDNDNITILDFDLDRVYLAVDSKENNYTIRMWNISEYGIRFSLYKDGEIAEEIIKSKYYNFPIKS